MTRLAQWRRAAATMAGRLFHAIGRCRRGVAALEFAIVATPLMTLMFGFIATSAVFYTWSAMQGTRNTPLSWSATGQVKKPGATGAIRPQSTCSGSLSNTKAEYYACTGLPSWVDLHGNHNRELRGAERDGQPLGQRGPGRDRRRIRDIHGKDADGQFSRDEARARMPLVRRRHTGVTGQCAVPGRIETDVRSGEVSVL